MVFNCVHLLLQFVILVNFCNKNIPIVSDFKVNRTLTVFTTKNAAFYYETRLFRWTLMTALPNFQFPYVTDFELLM